MTLYIHIHSEVITHYFTYFQAPKNPLLQIFFAQLTWGINNMHYLSETIMSHEYANIFNQYYE